VAVNPTMTCGICRYCKAGLRNHCENWTTLEAVKKFKSRAKNSQKWLNLTLK
jgi:threonine dehydrogenase-like Zn-dependent dehydrogenase